MKELQVTITLPARLVLHLKRVVRGLEPRVDRDLQELHLKDLLIACVHLLELSLMEPDGWRPMAGWKSKYRGELKMRKNIQTSSTLRERLVDLQLDLEEAFLNAGVSRSVSLGNVIELAYDRMPNHPDGILDAVLAARHAGEPKRSEPTFVLPRPLSPISKEA